MAHLSLTEDRGPENHCLCEGSCCPKQSPDKLSGDSSAEADDWRSVCGGHQGGFNPYSRIDGNRRLPRRELRSLLAKKQKPQRGADISPVIYAGRFGVCKKHSKRPSPKKPSAWWIPRCTRNDKLGFTKAPAGRRY